MSVVRLNVCSRVQIRRLFWMSNTSHNTKCACYILLTIPKGRDGNSLLLYLEFESMFSPVESLSSLLYSKSSSVVGLLQLGLVFETWKGHRENRIEKLWLWPFHANSNWGTQNLSDSGNLSSILICFIKENICWTLAFDTGSKNNNSTSIETRCHKLLWLDWKIYVKQHNIWSF